MATKNFKMEVFERGMAYEKRETFQQLTDILNLPAGTDLKPYLNAWQEQLADYLVQSGRFTKVTRIWLIDNKSDEEYERT